MPVKYFMDKFFSVYNKCDCSIIDQKGTFLVLTGKTRITPKEPPKYYLGDYVNNKLCNLY